LVAEVRLQVVDEQRRLAELGYDSRVVCVKIQLDVVRGGGHVVYIRLKRIVEIKPPCANPARMQLRDDVDVRKNASNIRPEGWKRWCE
jgi:hypothetical protein